MHQQPETCPIGLRLSGSQRGVPHGARGVTAPHRHPRLDNRDAAALIRRTVTLARCGTFLFPLSVRVRTSARALPVAQSSVSIGDGNLSACVVRHGAPGDPATRTDGLHETPRDAGDSFFRSACRRAAASPMAERQGGLSNWWTSHRPGWSDLAVRRRVAHGIQPKSRAAGERSTASYTACASSARRDSLLPIFPKRPARGARRRGDGRGARILLGRGRVRVRGRVRGRGRGRVTP